MSRDRVLRGCRRRAIFTVAKTGQKLDLLYHSVEIEFIESIDGPRLSPRSVSLL